MKKIKTQSENINIAKNLLAGNPNDFSKDPKVLSEIIDTDIRESLPPQMLAVINAVFKVISEIES